MAHSVRGWILMEFGIAVCCVLIFFTGSATAQHSGRIGPPIPIPRAPIYQPPIYRPPSYAPLYAPRPSAPVSPLNTITVRPPYFPIHRFPPTFRFYTFPVVNTPFSQSTFCWWATCNPLWTSTFIYNYNAGALTQWNPTNYIAQPPSAPVYIYGAERPDHPQLFLNDGSILYVSDYWLVDSQLHFMMMEQEGVKPTEQVIPFDELDLQKTIDVNTQRGFRFILRNAPFEQYVRDHPEGPPSDAISPNQ